VNIDPSGGRGTDELILAWPVTTIPATGGFFQRPEPFTVDPPVLPSPRRIRVHGDRRLRAWQRPRERDSTLSRSLFSKI
jgi:hypothetical protein